MIDYTNEIKSFLGNDRQKVLMIEGPWGIGKTYYWKQFIAANKSLIRESEYAYVSLFGLPNLQSLKGLLLTNAVSAKGAGKATPWAQLRRKLGGLPSAFKDIEIPWIKLKLEAVLPNIEELLINKFLICLDDLERRNRGFEIDELLGFISRLRDEKSCRIVLICNTTEFSAEDKDAVAKFREKVIDRHISFAPSIESNFQLIFDSSYNFVGALFVKLGLNNIRVMQRTKWAIDYFSDALKEANDDVGQEANLQIARLAIVHYAYPVVIKVGEMGTVNWMVDLWRDKEQVSEETSKKLQLVQQLGYGPSALDALIISYLQSGYCDQVALAEVIKNLIVGDLIQRGKEEIYALWALIYGNFAISEDDISHRFETCLAKYGDTIHLWSIYQFSEILDELNIQYQREKCQELIRRRISIAGAEEIRNLAKSGKWPEVLNALIRERQEVTATRPKVEALIIKLSDGSGWDPQDFSRLAQFSEDELFEWIFSARDQNLLHALKEVLKRASMKDCGAGGTGVEEKLKAAIARISKTSTLNTFRVEKYVG